jgi:membrane protein DedA with SNARE-associated domain
LKKYYLDFTASTWATIYVVIGYIIGPSWNLFTKDIGSFKYFMLAVLITIFCTVLFVYYYRKKEKHKANTAVNQS